MVKGGPLLPLLRRIRRRVRLFAAIEGGIWGGALAAVALAAGIVIVRQSGGAPTPAGAAFPISLGLAGVLAGAIWLGARRIPLARCARIADAALDGQDRVLSALCLERDAPSPLVAALVADAVGVASRLAPARAWPARRPEGLPALGLAAIALGAAILFPVSSRAARMPSASARPAGARRPPLEPGEIDVEREQARAALAEAGKLGDERLAALAADFERTLRGLSSGTLDDGQALERLRALEARATEAAGDAERDRRAADAAARALGDNAQTRAAGQALAAGDGDAGERARAALGASAGVQPNATGRALEAAARAVAGAASNPNGPNAPNAPNAASAAEQESLPRRLARNAAGADLPTDPGRDAPDHSGARRLEQLRRDLDDAAAACRDGDPSCRTRAEARAQDLARLSRQGAAADGLRRLERAAGQMRDRVGRGELRDGDALAAREFGRAANGEGKSAGARASAGAADRTESGPAGFGKGTAARPSSANGTGDEGTGAGDDDHGAAPAAGAQAAAIARGDGAQPSDVTGDGIGRQPGGAPLGSRDDMPVHGNATEARLANGAGPTRAEVIGAAAGRGFVARGYAHVFTDYAAAVEDALGTTAVPEGKRFIVRRYFDLIRPRSAR